MDAGLVHLLRLTRHATRQLLVEHDERCVRIVAPPEVDAAPAYRGEVFGTAELLDVVEAHVEADEIAVEGQRAIHVAHADGHVGDAVNGHRSSVFLDRSRVRGSTGTGRLSTGGTSWDDSTARSRW